MAGCGELRLFAEPWGMVRRAAFPARIGAAREDPVAEGIAPVPSPPCALFGRRAPEAPALTPP